jgi:ABC-type Mn2+/Zn2+ transport system permease subunit
MQSIRYLTDPDLAWIYWPPLVAGLAIALVCAVLSIGASAAIAGLSRRGTGVGADTAIGIVLVASMAIGFLLHAEAAEISASKGVPRGPGIESILFGSIIGVGWSEAIVAWAVALVVLFAVFLLRRQFVFWAFDEPVAPAFGVPADRVRVVVLVLLALAIVSTMRLAGVVLATAMLVLPAATALQVSDRLGRVVWLSVACGVLSVAVGVLASMELDAQVGPAIVLVLCAIFGIARAAALVRNRRRSE